MRIDVNRVLSFEHMLLVARNRHKERQTEKRKKDRKKDRQIYLNKALVSKMKLKNKTL